MYIVHNADYQGNEFTHREDLLNTLFGQYTADIVENAKTIGFWVYLPDEFVHCWIRVHYWIDSNNDGKFETKNTISKQILIYFLQNLVFLSSQILVYETSKSFSPANFAIVI